MVTAGAVLIGDELLSAKVRDANGPYLITQLRTHGVDLGEIHVVGDSTEAIAESVNLVRSRCDLCFTSGGIGPTHDDITLQAIATAFQVPLEEKPELTQIVKRVFGTGESGRAWQKLAHIPRGAVLKEFDGTWPIYTMDNVYILPGVPAIFAQQLDAILDGIEATPVMTSVAYFRIGEGAIAAQLTTIADAFAGQVSIGSYPDFKATDYKVRVTLESRDATRLAAATDLLRAAFPGDAIIRIDQNAQSLDD